MILACPQCPSAFSGQQKGVFLLDYISGWLFGKTLLHLESNAVILSWLLPIRIAVSSSCTEICLESLFESQNRSILKEEMQK
ncbi:hypothetical protein BLX87_17875 [Bacillus sp. VT-16-64]|nr:hypothetical protein BLX87_17875 [Bacillus sp. VT-16-64]